MSCYGGAVPSTRTSIRRPDAAAALAIAGGGFLLAVLWMDLMFDVQTRQLGVSGATDVLILRSIAAYYRRVTTEAFPMNRLIGGVMVVTLGAAIWRAVRLRTRAGLVSVLLAGGPIGLAAVRILPNAVRLGAAADPPGLQAALARTIFHDHVLCVVSIGLFTLWQLASRRGPEG